MIIEVEAREIIVGDKMFQAGEWFTVQSREMTDKGRSVFIKTEIGLVRYGANSYQTVTRDRVQDETADSAKAKLTVAEYDALAKLIRRSALADAISAVEESGGNALDAVLKLYDAV